MLKRKQFDDSFKWGTTISAFQNEGWAKADGKGASIWDTFSDNIDNIKNNDLIGNASNFYKDYETDIKLAASLHLQVFRFSISWTRIYPQGDGPTNQSGVDFYHKVIDCCLQNNLEPWVTLYHWDLPQRLEDLGGWTTRAIVHWFTRYADFCTKEYGSKVKHWIVLNEPMTFTGLGHFMGYHAPEKKGIADFLKAVHHATLCNAEGGRIVRKNVPNAVVGTAFSCSYIKPTNNKRIHRKAARRVEAILNRLFIEPALGMGYPTDIMPGLNLIQRYFKKGDEERLAFDFDFIGLQYYFKVVAKFSLFPPVLFASEVEPDKNSYRINAMGLETYPKGMSKVLKFYANYPNIKKIIITESGVCFPDHLSNGKIYDIKRVKYHRSILKEILKQKKKGVPVEGYFIWTLIDNFEWKEGYEPRFGIIYNDFKTQKRTIKYSGLWFKDFLNNQQ